MPTTGAEFYEHIKNAIDQEYSGYMAPDDANRLVKQSLIRVSENIYSKNRTQKATDELSPLTVLDRVIAVRGNRFFTSPLRISAATFIGVTVTVTTDEEHQLAVGDSVTIADVQGLNINGTFVVTSTPTTQQITFVHPTVTGTYVTGTGNVTTPFMLADMQHPLAIQTTFPYDNHYSSYDIVSVNTSANPYISFNYKNIVRTGSQVRISGALGVTGLNGDFYTKTRNKRSFYLYTDKALTTPAILSGTYQNGGVAKLVVREYATRLHSDRRIAPSSNGDVWTPKFGVSTNAILLYPSEATCESVKVDYLRQSPIEVDVEDTAIDLELYFNFKFLMKVKDDVSVLWAMRMRELPQAQAEMANAAMNP